jgi:hypothetical protein
MSAAKEEKLCEENWGRIVDFWDITSAHLQIILQRLHAVQIIAVSPSDEI